MTDEPTKAAIERACELLGYTPHDRNPRIEAVARHLDQVSETAKHVLNGGKVQALFSLTLPDPEPDVLAEVLVAFGKVPGSANYNDQSQRAKILRTELAKRGYAITKTGEAGQ